ncbi:WXG100 family type VII secretion target [Streptomyces cellulosae]|uniref:putative T7SS-secreted protein n=1 Tax=unclassified Streptomyces TaxID=2593676 RepID=UPI00131A4838|nr:WXG100 family type VII secretion target [Streptomyces sp. McG8]
MAEARAADFPALGFVPCPGDHSVADDVAKTVRRTAKALVEICQVLQGTGVGDWEGKAAKAFREKFDDEFRPRMDEARDSFGAAATALEDWASYMERKQAAAVRLEARAAAVDEQLGKARKKSDNLKNAGDDDTKDADDNEEKLKAAGRAVSVKEEELEELRRRGRRMAKAYREYGKEVAERLRKAMDIAPNEPGMWDKLGDAIKDLGKALADLPGQVGEVLSAIGDWIKSHADWITVAASVIGVIAIFCPVLAPLAIGLSAVALLAHAASYGVDGLWPPTGERIGNWLTLGGDALGMIPGVGAAKAGVMAGLKAGRGAGGVVAGTKVGIKTGSTVAKNAMKAADPVATVIDKPIMAAAAKLGLSRGVALTTTEGVQAAAQLAWTAPTAVNAYETSTGRYDAATWGTGVANVVTGTGGGRFGGLVAVGSAIGLGAWELTD